MSGVQKKIIILDGPASAGKSVSADIIYRYVRGHAGWINIERNHMATRVKKAVHVLFGLFEEPEYISAMGKKDEPHRDLPHDFVAGRNMTPREAYIWLIHAMQLDYDADVLGRMMETQLRNSKAVLHIFDSAGQLQEWAPIIAYVGARNVCVIEIPSGGRTHEGNDTRKGCGRDLATTYPKLTYISIPDAMAYTVDKDLFRVLLQGATKRFLKLEGED